jgi:hypothetical protein
LKVFFISFSEPISSFLLYHWIQFCNARKNFHVQLWFIFAQKRIQTAGLSKYFVNYTKYIMACTLRSKSLCSRSWIVIPRPHWWLGLWLVVFFKNEWQIETDKWLFVSVYFSIQNWVWNLFLLFIAENQVFSQAWFSSSYYLPRQKKIS